MSIRFYCPLGHRLKVPDHRAGKKGRCPVCRERVIVPSVGLTRERLKRLAPSAPAPATAEIAPSGSLPPGRPRTFDQLAAEFLTRETEFGIAAKMAAISEQAEKKKSARVPSETAPAQLDEAPVDFELPQEQHAAAAATVAEAPLASVPLADAPDPAAPLVVEPFATAPVHDDHALASFLAASAPAPPGPQAVVAPRAAMPSPTAPSPTATSLPVPSLPVSSPAPVPPPIMPPAAPPRAAIAEQAMLPTSWWAWATRDTLGQYPIHRPTAGQLEATYWLASLLPFAIVLCAAPAVSHLRLNTAPSWAQVMLLLAGAQLAYAVWLALLPDYSTLRVGAFLFAASAALEGLAMIVSLSNPAWLAVSARGSAAVWCGGCLAAMAGLSFACAKIARRWLPEPGHR